jgi:hypothetical protein
VQWCVAKLQTDQTGDKASVSEDGSSIFVLRSTASCVDLVLKVDERGGVVRRGRCLLDLGKHHAQDSSVVAERRLMQRAVAVLRSLHGGVSRYLAA